MDHAISLHSFSCFIFPLLYINFILLIKNSLLKVDWFFHVCFFPHRQYN